MWVYTPTLQTLGKGPRKHIFRTIPTMYICFLYSQKSPSTEAAPREKKYLLSTKD